MRRRALHILITLWGMVLPYAILAQDNKDKVEALRMAFISKKLELTSAENERFWPVYNEYNDKVKAIKRNLRQSYVRKGENLSDADAEELILLETQSKQAELDLYKSYSEKLKAIIGVKKLAKLHRAEEEFKREIINTIREK